MYLAIVKVEVERVAPLQFSVLVLYGLDIQGPEVLDFGRHAGATVCHVRSVISWLTIVNLLLGAAFTWSHAHED